MAKKRTVLPYYGKLSQRLDTEATAAARRGNHALAKKLHDKAKEIRYNRKKGKKS